LNIGSEEAMLTLFRRHLKSCPQTSRTYRRCACPISVEGSLGGESIRRALDLTSWTAAVKLIRAWEDAGRIGAEALVVPTIAEGIEKYLEAKKNKHLAEATIAKLRTIFEKQLLGSHNRQRSTATFAIETIPIAMQS
jgi:hypothetical protein